MESKLGQFAIDIYTKAALRKADENVFLSPWSIYGALSMVLAGATDNTHQQILSSLHLESHFQADKQDKQVRHEELGSMLRKPTEDTGDVTISLANRIFIEQSYKSIKKEFLDLMQQAYESEIGQVPFVANKAAAIAQINQWVEDKTNKRIKDLLHESVIHALTRVVLVNAVHFKGNWSDTFSESATQRGTFYCLDKTNTQVDMMQREGQYHLAKFPKIGARVLWIPFKMHRFHVLIILPTDRYGIKQLQQTLVSQNKEINRTLWTQPSGSVLVNVKVPKVHLECKSSLKELLSQHLGMSDMFDEGRARFGELTAEDNLVVDDVIHQAFFEVNTLSMNCAKKLCFSLECVFCLFLCLSVCAADG